MAAELMTFDDVPADHPAAQHIAAVVRAGVVSPLSMNPPRFGPDYAVTRSQFAVYLARAMGLSPEDRAEPTFADVSKTHWAYGFVEAMNAQGVLRGAADKPLRFLPDEAITRAAITVALCRAKGLDPLPRDPATFGDVPQDHWAHGWVERLVDRDSWGGILVSGGTDAGPPLKFSPGAIVTRASMAVLLSRAFGMVRE